MRRLITIAICSALAGAAIVHFESERHYCWKCGAVVREDYNFPNMWKCGDCGTMESRTPAFTLD